MGSENINKMRIVEESLIMKELLFNAKPKNIISYSQKNGSEDGYFSPKYRFPENKVNNELFKLIIRNSLDNEKSVIFSKSMQDYILKTDELDSKLKEIYKLFFKDLPLLAFKYK